MTSKTWTPGTVVDSPWLQDVNDTVYDALELIPTSATRSAQAKFTDFISVKDFGATGNGITDDILAINAGVDYLVTLGGGTLYFPQGTYAVSTNVKLRDNIVYQGSGWNSIIKARSNSLDNVMGHYGPDYDFDIYGVVIKDLQIDGNKANVAYNTANAGTTDDAYQNGIRLHKVKRYRIENVWIHDTVFNGISVYFISSDGVIENNFIQNIGKTPNPISGAYSYEGIFVEFAADNVSIQNNKIDTTRDMGVLLQNSGSGGIRYCHINNNYIVNCFAQGICVRDQSSSVTGALENIQINENILIGNCTGSTDAAIRVQRSTTGQRTYDIIVANNQVILNNFIGILIDIGTERGVVEGNICRQNTNKGLVIAGTDITVRSNICLNNGTDSIDTSSATRASMLGNVTTTTAAEGVSIDFTPSLLTGGLAVGRAYGTQLGRGILIGGEFHFDIQIALTNKGSSTGAITIGGFPSGIVSRSAGPFSVCQIGTANISWTTTPFALVLNAASVVSIFSMVSGGGTAALTDSNLSNTSTLYISGIIRL